MTPADAIITAAAIDALNPDGLTDFLATLPERERETAANAVRVAHRHREDAAALDEYDQIRGCPQ